MAVSVADPEFPHTRSPPGILPSSQALEKAWIIKPRCQLHPAGRCMPRNGETNTSPASPVTCGVAWVFVFTLIETFLPIGLGWILGHPKDLHTMVHMECIYRGKNCSPAALEFGMGSAMAGWNVRAGFGLCSAGDICWKNCCCHCCGVVPRQCLLMGILADFDIGSSHCFCPPPGKCC